MIVAASKIASAYTLSKKLDKLAIAKVSDEITETKFDSDGINRYAREVVGMLAEFVEDPENTHKAINDRFPKILKAFGETDYCDLEDKISELFEETDTMEGCELDEDTGKYVVDEDEFGEGE